MLPPRPCPLQAANESAPALASLCRAGGRGGTTRVGASAALRSRGGGLGDGAWGGLRTLRGHDCGGAGRGASGRRSARVGALLVTVLGEGSVRCVGMTAAALVVAIGL